MRNLIDKLEKLYQSDNAAEQDYYSGRYYFNESEMVNEVTNLCCDMLICDNGECNWDNITILRRNGYSVFPGERDSFGWLTGCVKKNGDRRIVVYG